MSMLLFGKGAHELWNGIDLNGAKGKGLGILVQVRQDPKIIEPRTAAP
jgi:hypothetical protein